MSAEITVTTPAARRALGFTGRPAPAELLLRAERMTEACAKYGVPLAAAALQFSLRDPRVTSTIVGFSHPQRVAQTVELATVHIPAALWTDLEAGASIE